MVITSKTAIQLVYDENCKSGIVKIAGKVKDDIAAVVGKTEKTEDSIKIVFGIAGESAVLDDLEKQGLIDTAPIQGKREVYGFYIRDNENSIFIAGSDKRGTIYGLFHISELIGVSPLINWSGVKPPKKPFISLSASDSLISKEPSVIYRGFFINDEWPAFGNWCSIHYGGFTAKMYENVFELLLRMKGNYLWPAMWSSSFACDGPGLASAELADEYGVVIGLSHHEPCLRHGEEYSRLRGPQSIYGDAWDFRTNREGITRFWRDGLKRNGHLENVITVGMRGERDSKLLGENSTLADNIELLRSVFETQNTLIREEVDPNLDSVPRMFALYKEVEPYFYGDGETKGLMGSDELDGVILMLCDDNHGYLRTLPDEKMREHRGGYGMYYHFDYHGEPVSYEWINSTHLPEVWEQMTTAYEHGVRSLWIVNVGDLGLNEMPLSYFLDLAYDYDKWGINAPDMTDRYTEQWMKRNFGGALDDTDIKRLTEMYIRFTRLLHNRRPEHMSHSVYDVRSFGEAEHILAQATEAERICNEIGAKIPEELRAAYTELISYIVLAGANLIKMWIYSGYDKYFAGIGAICANDYAENVKKCLIKDKELINLLHTVGGKRFDGFGLAPHIGFRNWNFEESINPSLEYVIPVDRADIKVGLLYEPGETSGHEWTNKVLSSRHFLHKPDKNGTVRSVGGFFAALMGREPVEYTVECDKDWLVPEKSSGTLNSGNTIERILYTINDEKLLKVSAEDIASDTAVITVKYPSGKVHIKVYGTAVRNTAVNVFHEENGLICADAENYSARSDNGKERFMILRDLGRDSCGAKVFPIMADTSDPVTAPYIEYNVCAAENGGFDMIFFMQPCNPYKNGCGIKIAYSVNGSETVITDTIADSYRPGVTADWAEGVLTHIRKVKTRAILKKGMNTVRFYGISREAVLEKIMFVRDGENIRVPYLGTPESM